MNVQHLQRLNQHPLNQAALRRLQVAGGHPMEDQIHLLSLAHLGSLDAQGEPPAPDGPVGKVLGDWGRPNSQRQATALAELEHALTPEWVEEANLDKVAEQIVQTLGQAGM